MNPTTTFNPGEDATIRHSIHSPYSGRTGVVLDYDPSDKRGGYLVLFSDGLKFRYKAGELERPGAPHPSRVFGTLSRVIGERRHGLFRGPQGR